MCALPREEQPGAEVFAQSLPLLVGLGTCCSAGTCSDEPRTAAGAPDEVTRIRQLVSEVEAEAEAKAEAAPAAEVEAEAAAEAEAEAAEAEATEAEAEGAKAKADERAIWMITSTVDWSDLVPAGSGHEIEDTARRAISLEQLLRLQAHADRRLRAQEQWEVWRPDDPHHLIASIDEVLATKQCVVLCQHLVCVWYKVSLYDVAKYVIKPATIESRWSLVEVRLHGYLLRHNISPCCMV